MRPLRRCTYKWKDYIKVVLQTKFWAVDLICVRNEALDSIQSSNFLTSLASVSFPTVILNLLVAWGQVAHTVFRVGSSTWCLRPAWCATTLPWSSAGVPRSSLAWTPSSSSSLMLALSTSGSRILLPGESPKKWSLDLTLASRCGVGLLVKGSRAMTVFSWWLKTSGWWRSVDCQVVFLQCLDSEDEDTSVTACPLTQPKTQKTLIFSSTAVIT